MSRVWYEIQTRIKGEAEWRPSNLRQYQNENTARHMLKRLRQTPNPDFDYEYRLVLFTYEEEVLTD
jgi:hypothetical protein